MATDAGSPGSTLTFDEHFLMLGPINMSLDTAKLTKLLADKCQLLTQLRQLGARQFQSIDTADLSQLLNLLAAKQRLIGGLQTIEQQLNPYREQSPDEREWASPADRHQCAQLAETCQQLLAEVVEIEKQSEHCLVLRRDEAATRLQAAHFASQARQAYDGPAGVALSQVDLSSE
jgi:flagellar biosynthesis/type III secretory pathway chaperone